MTPEEAREQRDENEANSERVFWHAIRNDVRECDRNSEAEERDTAVVEAEE